MRRPELSDLAREGVFVRGLTNIITLWYHGAEHLYVWTEQRAVGRVLHDLLQTEFPKPLSEIEKGMAEPQNECWHEGASVAILSVRERVRRFDGQLDIKSGPTGTTVRVSFPTERVIE